MSIGQLHWGPGVDRSESCRENLAPWRASPEQLCNILRISRATFLLDDRDLWTIRSRIESAMVGSEKKSYHFAFEY